MSKADIQKKVKQFADMVKAKFPVKMIILQKAYPGEENRKDPEIEVAVVVDELEDDFIEVKDQLTTMANRIDPHIDIVLIERQKEDPIGFYDEVRKTGQMIYQAKD